MADWKDQYLAALEARDQVEKANQEVYHTYARLADRTALLCQTQPSLSSPQAAEASTQPPSSPSSPIIPPPPILRPRSQSSKSPPQPDNQTLTQLRADFLSTQTARMALESQLETSRSQLTRLQTTHAALQRRSTTLTAQVTQLTQRLRDQAEELRGKAKLLEDVQDENATLNLQLDLADRQARELRRENQDLVDRWMAKVGQEAERMNEEGRFG